MSNALAFRFAALFGVTAVALGAFGAHALKEVLSRNDTAAIWQTAVLYHFIHTLMLVILATRVPLRLGPWWSFAAGIIIFSGSLYLLAITNLRWLGAITPLGGASFLVGWIWLMVCPGPRTPSSTS
jgi:uncharacterized membrane protein YgdD (TMEM256/DUF423 family)